MSSRPPASIPDPAVYLVALDGTSHDDRVIEVACGLGAALSGAAELHVLHVLGSLSAEPEEMAPVLVSVTELLEGGRRLLDRSTSYAAGHFQGRVVGHLGAGSPWRAIVQMASSLRADLAVVGTAGRTGVARLTLGSAAEQVVRHAGCPVLVVRPKDYHSRDEHGIEPPCGDCIATQAKTGRAKLWCERHNARHPQGRLHYELPATFAVGSMNLRP